MGGEENFTENWIESIGVIHFAAVERYNRGEGENEERQKTEEKEIQACFLKDLVTMRLNI